MSTPEIAGKAPKAVHVEAGRAYFWCACGKSRRQPFCDGSHAGTGLEPVRYDAGETKTVYFCMCKHTRGQPFCDGSHSGL